MLGLDQLLRQLSAFWAGLGSGQRVAFFSIALISLGVLSLLVNFANVPDYSTLYSNLAPEDAANIVDELKTANVDFKLTHAGTAIQVPVQRLYDLRLEMAGKGLPASGPVGFEIFNDSGLGITPFQERIRFRRALEGELARTISQLSPVNWARIHISLPERSVFKRKGALASASVVLNLTPGGRLSGVEVTGITHLIAGAVEGIEANQVTLMDSKGRLLTRPGGDEAEVIATGAMDLQRSIEGKLAGRAQSLLDAALGAGNSLVTVAATINRQRFEEKQERVNPEESAVLSEQRSEETRSGPGGLTGGVPGTPSNLPGGVGTEESGSQASTESVTRETINFEISRSSSQRVVPMGEIQRLSVAVLIDGTYTFADVGELAEGETAPPPEYSPRSEEELVQFSQIVKRAVGFDPERGDVIEIQNLPFDSPLDRVEQEPLPFWKSPELVLLLPGMTKGLAVIGGTVLLILLVLRPALRQLGQGPMTAAAGASVGRMGAGAVAGTPGVPQTIEIQDPMAELAIPINKGQAKQVAEAMRQLLRE